METTEARAGLYLGEVRAFDSDNCLIGEGWGVLLRQAAANGRGAVCRPFASRRDAEIGLESLQACGVDWNASEDEVVGELRARGGRQFVDRVAYECLPW